MAFFATPKVAELQAVDPYDIGWWIESADEEIYGPVSRKTLRQFLEKGEISPNTLIRHSTQSETKPVADHSGMVEGLALDPQAPAVGDRLAEVWPRRWKDQLALAEDSLPCARHKRPAVLFCLIVTDFGVWDFGSRPATRRSRDFAANSHDNDVD